MRLTAILVAVMATILAGCLELEYSDDDEDTSQWVWSSRFLEFEQYPEVCDGVLSATGYLVGDSMFLEPEDTTTATFVVYRKVDSTPKYGYGFGSEDFVATPVLGFLEPPQDDEYYPSLDPSDQIATEYYVVESVFKLVSPVPDFLANDPEEYVLGVWGYRRPEEPAETLRTAVFKSCA